MSNDDEWPTIRQIENAFRPAKEADDPARFAGRKNQVEEAYRALLSDGTHIAFIGGRGVGKTSLAVQLQTLAGGDQTLLDRLEIPRDDPSDFLAVYFACGSSVSTLDDLLTQLLTSDKCLRPWAYDVPTAKKTVEEYAPKFDVGVIALGGRKTTETSVANVSPLAKLDTIFMNIIQAIAEGAGARDGVLVIVDEFDQIENPAGFGPFLKSLATNAPKVKFCIVGVAHDIQRLMQQHESSDRLFAGSVITVPGMEDYELREIIDIAEQSIAKMITFDESARARLVELANGHPYMVHLIGKLALRSAHREKMRAIDDDHILLTIQSLAERGGDPALEGRYKKAIASSPQRETVLRALAENLGNDGEVHTTAAYKDCIEKGVDNPSQYVGNLVTQDYGAEIERVRERYYRFRDSLFHTYVLVRPPYHSSSST